jgi:glycosyltransferase involved in cell wall biosynthesis
VLLRNAVDTRPFVTVTRTSRGSRLVWVRAFHEIYNPVMAIEVLALVARDRPDVSLTMLGPDKGDGSHAAVLAAADRLGVRDRLNLVGPVPKSDIPMYLANSDLLINTTNVDNTPISVLEAMAAGVPVVSTAVGGIPFLLEHERTALLVPARDPVAMASSVLHLLDDPKLYASLETAARAFAHSCDWSVITSDWLRVLDSAVARG